MGFRPVRYAPPNSAIATKNGLVITRFCSLSWVETSQGKAISISPFPPIHGDYVLTFQRIDKDVTYRYVTYSYQPTEHHLVIPLIKELHEGRIDFLDWEGCVWMQGARTIYGRDLWKYIETKRPTVKA